MRFFALLMSVYLLVLSCIPCSDRDECSYNAVQTISSTNHDKQHNPTNEVCTPFCSCSCCQASAFYQPIEEIIFTKMVVHDLKYPAEYSSFYSKVSFSIWQPPKIA